MSPKIGAKILLNFNEKEKTKRGLGGSMKNRNVYGFQLKPEQKELSPKEREIETEKKKNM